MATRREVPADFAAALDRYPAARDRFAAMPATRQDEWLAWIDRARGRRGRATRIDDAIRRLSPPATASEEQIAEPVGPPPERGWWLWLLLLLLLVVAGLLLWYFLSRGSSKTTVPAVVGLPSAQAAARIHAAHLNVSPVTGASRRPPGIVFSQRPVAGVQVHRNRTVRISISSGPAHKAVPNVVGLSEAQATRTLSGAGFSSSVRRHASTRPHGIVFAQQPIAGVAAAKGTTVILSVSSGVKPVAVPSVVGQTQGAALTTLTRAGLKPKPQNVPSTQPAGQVVSQKPPAGTRVDKGSTVTLNISRGTGGGTTTLTTTTSTTTTTGTTTTTAAPRVPIPAVSGLAFTAGARRLNTAGFRLTATYVSSSQPAGRIVSAPPASGSAPKGSRVALGVSTGPNPAASTAVPNVVGQTQRAAATTILHAGLKALVLFRKVTNPSKNGIVVDEQPVAGSSIPGASYVAIFVGRT